MKKWIVLMCVFAGSVASMAATMSGPQYLVYDYKASIQRLDIVISSIKYSLDTFDLTTNNATLDCVSYQVVADSLKGYLFVPICQDCTADKSGSDTSLPFRYQRSTSDYDSMLYLMRTADKSKGVWKAWAHVDAGLFNKGVGARPFDLEDPLNPDNLDDSLAYYMGIEVDENGDPILDEDGNEIPWPYPTWAPTSLKKLKGAWMEVYFGVGDCADDYVLGNYGVWPYGFLGHGSSETWLNMTGFGSAAQLTQAVFCKPATKCFTVGSISGSLIGWAYHKPVCRFPPIWDVCTLEGIDESRVTGTWSIKFNSKLTTTVLGFDTWSMSPEEEALLVDDLFGVGVKKHGDLIPDCGFGE